MAFQSNEKIDDKDYNTTPLYSRVWSTLQRYYGKPINKDGNGSCFRGTEGDTAVLTDSLTDKIHRLVLVDVSLPIVAELEELVNKRH
jgi:hypothetical protein